MNDGAGGTVFTAIVGNPTDFTSLSHTETGLTSGATYKFKYRAKNVHGWSTGYSPEVSILIATVPDKPTAVQTVNNGLSVDISWTAPAFTGGDSVALTSYTIQILKSDGLTYSTELTGCPGTNPALTTCSVFMSTLWASPFLLEYGEDVIARVKTANSLGEGEYSDDSTTNAEI